MVRKGINLENIPCISIQGNNVICSTIKGRKYTRCYLETLMLWGDKREKEMILAKLN